MYHLALALGDVFATINIDPFKPGGEVQSNRLTLTGDATPIDQKIMDTDIERFVEVWQKCTLMKKWSSTRIEVLKSNFWADFSADSIKQTDSNF